MRLNFYTLSVLAYRVTAIKLSTEALSGSSDGVLTSAVQTDPEFDLSWLSQDAAETSAVTLSEVDSHHDLSSPTRLKSSAASLLGSSALKAANEHVMKEELASKREQLGNQRAHPGE